MLTLSSTADLGPIFDQVQGDGTLRHVLSYCIVCGMPVERCYVARADGARRWFPRCVAREIYPKRFHAHAWHQVTALARDAERQGMEHFQTWTVIGDQRCVFDYDRGIVLMSSEPMKPERWGRLGVQPERCRHVEADIRLGDTQVFPVEDMPMIEVGKAA